MHLKHLPPGTQGRSDVYDHASMVLEHMGERSEWGARGDVTQVEATLTLKNFS